MDLLKESNNDFFIKSTFKRYMIPSVLSVLGSIIAVIFDSIIIGNYIGPEGLAALSIAKPVYYTFMMIGVLINVGAATNATIYIGEGKQDKKVNMMMLALTMSCICGVVISLLGLCFLNPIVHLLNGGSSLYQMVHDYAFVMMLGGTAVIFMYFPFNFLRVDGRPQYGVVVFVVMALLNLLLDILFVPILKLGMAGMSAACVFSALAADILGLVFTFSKAGTLKVKKVIFSLSEIKKILVSGSSMALNNGCNIFRTLFMNNIIFAAFGGMALAVFSLTSSIGMLSLAIISGIAQTITPLIGVFYGEKDITSIRQTVRTAIKVGLVMIVGFALLISIFSVPVCYMFGIKDAKTVAMAIPAVWLFCASLVFGMINNIYISSYFTTGWNLLANLITFLRAFAFVVLSALLFSSINSIIGVWASFIVADMATFAVFWVITVVKRHKNNNLSGTLLLNSTFEKCGKYISFSVPNQLSAVAEASEKIDGFCEQNELDIKTSMMISLSLEEMLVCICEHCFSEGEKQFVDVRIFILNDMVILRMRNTGIIFDPVRYYEEKASESGEKILEGDSLGISMIVKKADIVTFNRTFGVNNLTIIIPVSSKSKKELYITE